MFYAVFTSNFKVTVNDKSKSVIRLLSQGQSKPFLKPNWQIFPSQKLNVTSASQKVNSKFTCTRKFNFFLKLNCHIRLLFSSVVM